MSTIHKLSNTVPLDELDLWGVPHTQFSITDNIETEHRPISTLDSKSPIEFHITSGIDEYLRLDKTNLYIKIKVFIEKPSKTTATMDD